MKRNICPVCQNSMLFLKKEKRKIYWVKIYECQNPFCKFLNNDCQRIFRKIEETLSRASPWINILDNSEFKIGESPYYKGSK